MFRVQHALIFSSVIEVLMPDAKHKGERAGGLNVPRVGLLGGTFILFFILSMGAIPNSAALSANWAVKDHPEGNWLH